MILVDTSIWVAYLRSGNARLTRMLQAGTVFVHAWVIGEVALGHVRSRGAVLRLMRSLPRAVLATDDEVSEFVERNALYGTGIGYVDAQLLASARLTPGTRLWTSDKQLASIAGRLSINYS